MNKTRRNPDDWSAPNVEEAKNAYEIALKIKEYVIKI